MRAVHGLHNLAAWLALASHAHGATGGFEYDPQQKIESAPLYGNMNQYAYYFMDLLVGSPVPQRASVIIDTGSRLVGFPCSECQHCGNHLDPAYDASSSESLRWLDCDNDCSGTCFEDHCTYREAYAEGSEISGLWFDDLVELGDALSKNPPVRVHLGCHTSENNLFYDQRANGIMGLALDTGTASNPTILQQLFQDAVHVNTTVFSICLATWGGRFTIGGYNDSHHIDPIRWIYMTPSRYYYVAPDGITLGDEDATEVISGSAVFGESIVDSGTTFTYFPAAVFAALMKRLSDFCEIHDDCGGRREYDGAGSPCWRLGALEGPAQFPPLRFSFGGSYIDWRPTSYLYVSEESDESLWCPAFMQNSMPQTVLGISFMLHKDFVFDVARSRLGVADAACPEYHEQPTLEQKFSMGGPGRAEPRLGAGMRGDLVAFGRGPLRRPVATVRSWAATVAVAACAVAMLGYRWASASRRLHNKARQSADEEACKALRRCEGDIDDHHGDAL